MPKIAQVPLTYEYAYGGKKITDNPSTEDTFCLTRLGWAMSIWISLIASSFLYLNYTPISRLWKI
ncbi:hypothetical protein [Thorsellia kenyensis]|uniref:Uncharacterized protein n=1 Tax=Thorsellia kenyensis TaxID=1549888 RepID=A0ABV6C9Y8_9GAMM